MAVEPDDLRDLRDTLLDEMRTGFNGIYARQDKTNGRLLVVEERTAEHRTQIRNLDREVFHVHRRRTDPKSGERTPITRRDVTLVVCGGAGFYAVLKALVWLGPALKGLTP